MKFLKAFFLIFNLLIFNNAFGAIDGVLCQKIIEETSTHTHCLNLLKTYPQPVHVYIPKTLNRQASVNINIHFHGHNLNGFSHFDKKFGDYGEYLSQSKSNSIVIIPESKGNCATYDEFFKSPKNGEIFFQEITSSVGDLNNKTYSFTGHSGAYRVLNTLLGYADLEKKLGSSLLGVGLMDATYGSTSNVENFALEKLKKGERFLFYDSYVVGKKATAQNLSLALKDRISKLNLSPAKAMIEANQACLEWINQNILEQKTEALMKPALKILIEKRFKFMELKSDEYPKELSVLDLHFLVLKKYGIEDFLKNL